MTQPGVVYPSLRSGANAHLGKLRRNEKTRPAGAALDRRLAELSECLRQQLPSQLDIAGQARFALGYDHQRAADLAEARARATQTTSTNHEEEQQ
jgi:CRISPR-associated protein Csd1